MTSQEWGWIYSAFLLEILGLPDVKSQLIGKDLVLGKIEDKRRRGGQRMRWLDSINNSMDMNLSKLQEIVKDKKPGVLQSTGSQRVRYDPVNGQQHHINNALTFKTLWPSG